MISPLFKQLALDLITRHRDALRNSIIDLGPMASTSGKSMYRSLSEGGKVATVINRLIELDRHLEAIESFIVSAKTVGSNDESFARLIRLIGDAQG